MLLLCRCLQRQPIEAGCVNLFWRVPVGLGSRLLHLFTLFCAHSKMFSLHYSTVQYCNVTVLQLYALDVTIVQ